MFFSRPESSCLEMYWMAALAAGPAEPCATTPPATTPQLSVHAATYASKHPLRASSKHGTSSRELEERELESPRFPVRCFLLHVALRPSG